MTGCLPISCNYKLNDYKHYFTEGIQSVCYITFDYFLLDPNGQRLPLAIAQYTFLFGKPLSVKMEPHGNAKSGCYQYIRTQHILELKDNIKEMTPKAAVHMVYDKAGGVTNTHSLSELPWDARQAYNLKSHSNCTSGVASSEEKDLVYDLL